MGGLRAGRKRLRKASWESVGSTPPDAGTHSAPEERTRSVDVSPAVSSRYAVIGS